ncbi:hypothetical protein [Kitasatospora sp. GP82]|uniref:hypothetical protein n=1 Tax=Kitasatospora sp. GP82 TaxID=3035089 RepID=UPI002474F180|nr:hypothetical protein [Kitasatospora sp. GP82]MDH6125934.1 putative kinase [Kitasatospora sp. GP82]
MSAVITLVVAVFGVMGTLLAPLLAQRAQAQVSKDDFERQQLAAQTQWDREQRQANLAQRRACYVATNAAYRRYRVEIMKFLWCSHQGGVTEQDRDVLEQARQAHHAAFAEAQMVASRAVLEQLDVVTQALSEAYRKTQCLHEGNPDPNGSFDEIRDYLKWLWERWEEMRSVMRVDLGIESSVDD